MIVYVVLIIQQLLASGTHLVAKVVVRDIEPVTLTMLRSIVAALGLLAYLFAMKKRIAFAKEDYKRIVWLSFLAIPVNQFLFLAGMRYSTPANAALFYGTTPAMVLVLSHFLGNERFTLKKVAGVGVAFLGILVIIFEHGIDFRSEYTFGNLLFLLAVIAWGLYTVQGRALTMKYGAFPTSTTTMILGALLFAPIGVFGLVETDIAALTIQDWGGVLYLAIGTSVLSYFLWYYALERIEASKVAVFSNIQPVMTIILAVLILDQQLTPEFLFGGALALVGVVLTQMG